MQFTRISYDCKPYSAYYLPNLQTIEWQTMRVGMFFQRGKWLDPYNIRILDAWIITLVPTRGPKNWSCKIVTHSINQLPNEQSSKYIAWTGEKERKRKKKRERERERKEKREKARERERAHKRLTSSINLLHQLVHEIILTSAGSPCSYFNSCFYYIFGSVWSGIIFDN